MGHSQLLDHFFEEQHHKWKKRAHEIYKSTCKEYGIHPNLDQTRKNHIDPEETLPGAEKDPTRKQKSPAKKRGFF